MKHCFLLRARRGFALGDVVLVTALARDIHAARPGEFRLMADTHFSQVWDNNPHVDRLDYKQPHQLLDLSYTKGIAASKRGYGKHFLSWFHKDFSERTGLPVAVTKPHGDLHLNDQEKKPPVNGRYWVVLAGGKLDMTVKGWGAERYQETVSRLAREGVRFVQAGAVHRRHRHKPLDGVVDAIGKTEDVRQFFSLIHGAEGVLCGVTAAMHLAACFHKPCVVLAGGREEAAWEAYRDATAFGTSCEPVAVPHRYLDAMGKLDCCRTAGCWKARVVPIPGDTAVPGNRSLCLMPVTEPGREPVAKCLEMVSPQVVAEAVLSYYRDGTLPATTGEPVSLSADDSASVPAPVVVTSRPQRTEHAMTTFVLCYGPHVALAKRCLDSILSTVPAGSLDLRIGCNACEPATLEYVRSLPATKVYAWEENRLKYPAMRDMFHDPECPITTPYCLWFDDDSFVKDPRWLEKLQACITANRAQGCRLYGAEFVHDFGRYRTPSHRPDRWFKKGAWHRGKDFLAGRGARFAAPNGSAIRFVAGGFFAVGTDAIQKAGIPDERLRHNGGDITIGEMVRQAGFRTCAFNSKKEFIHTSGADPRGESRVGPAKRFPWQEGGEGR